MDQIPEKNVYTIDRYDRIRSVGGGWDTFAAANDGAELDSSGIINTSFWDYIFGDTTIQVYRQILTAARAGKVMEFDLRCDSPDLRRFVKMVISPAIDDSVCLEMTTVRVEERFPQVILQQDGTCSETVVVTCSWCKKIRTDDGVWHEVEVAVPLLGLFELDEVPQLSHGMCEKCYEVVMQTITTS